MPNSLKKILIVEDSLINRFMVEKYLKSEGFHVNTASNGIEAIDLIKSSKPPHLIITDLHMPYMDGYQLLNNLRKNQNTFNIPIIAVSSYDLISEHNLQGHRFDLFVHKPFSLKLLTLEIHRLIEVSTYITSTYR